MKNMMVIGALFLSTTAFGMTAGRWCERNVAEPKRDRSGVWDRSDETQAYFRCQIKATSICRDKEIGSSEWLSCMGNPRAFW